MAELRCIHGLDARFCSICHRSKPDKGRSAQRNLVTDPGLEEIIQFLNYKRVRATYGAVAEVLGAIPRSMGARLTRLYSRHVDASWVVSAATGLPTGYGAHEMHQALHTAGIITNGVEFKKQLSAWKAARQD